MVHKILYVVVFWRKLPAVFLVARLVRQQSSNVVKLKAVTVSHPYQLSLVTWHFESVKQMHSFKEELLVNLGTVSCAV